MRRRTVLRTVDEVIEALGGTMRAAETTGQRWPQVVSNWKRRKRMPAKFYQLMSGELARMGYHASPDLWQQERS